MRCGWAGKLVLALALLAANMTHASADADDPAAQEEPAPMTPAEAAEKASRVNARGFQGKFIFEVKAVGTDGEDTFINSEPDFRDPRSLVLRVGSRVRGPLETRLGGKLEQLVGHRIIVSGAAVRVRMEVVEVKPTGALGEPARGDKQTTGEYYHQTHVKIMQPDQIVLL